MSLKKILIGLSAGLIISSTNAFALLGLVDVDAGGGVWMVGGSGEISGKSGDASAKVDFDYPTTYDNYYFNARVDHFVPLVPNVKVEILQHHLAGSAKGEITYTLFGTDYTFAANQDIDVTYMQQDYTLYWGVPLLNALTLGMFDLNAGLDLKNITVGAMTTDSVAKPSIGVLIPMYEVTAMVDLPMVPKIEATYRSLFGLLNDINAKVVLELPIPIPMVHVNIEGGYRIQMIDSEAINNEDNAWLKTTTGVFVDWDKVPATAITFQGLYGGVNVAF